MPLLSIIVPVYNIAKYIPECVDSVLNQSFNDLELILVNDGSTDESPKICKEYAEKDNRIIVINKKNGGLSDARNSGLSIAQGEYIFFLDGDDFLVPNQLIKYESLLNSSESADIYTVPHVYTFPSGKEEVHFVPMTSILEHYEGKKFLTKIISSNFIFWGVEKNIYKREIIENESLLFSKGLIGAEDCDFTMRYIRYCEKFCLVDIPLAQYRVGREGSITTNMSLNAIKGQLEVFYNNYIFYQNNWVHARKDAEIFFANKFANTVSLFYNLKNTEEINQMNKYISNRKKILKSTKGKKYDIAKLIWAILGYYRGSLFLNKIRKSYKKN